MSDANDPFSSRNFRFELGKVFDEKLKPITDLLEKHDAAIDLHEAALQQAKGERRIFAALWALFIGTVTAFVEWLFHAGHK